MLVHHTITNDHKEDFEENTIKYIFSGIPHHEDNDILLIGDRRQFSPLILSEFK